MNRRRSPSRAGFTLLEIVVASLAVSILLVAVYSVFAHGHRLRDRAEARTRDARLEARAIDVLRGDLASALVLAGPIADTLEGDTGGTGSQFPGYLKLTTATGRTQDDTPGSDIQEVEYFIEAETNATTSGGVLTRTVQRILLADAPATPQSQPLLHQVEAMTVTFYDGDQWLEQWDSTVTTNALPSAVRVRLDRMQTDDPSRPAPPLEVLVPWSTTPIEENDDV